MWVLTADELADAAAPIFFAAAEHQPRYEKAVEAASEEAERLAALTPEQGATAEIRCPEPKFLPAFLLYGYAVENLLKGLYVKANPQAIGPEAVGVRVHHDLRELAKSAGYNANRQEADILLKLTTVTKWSGRYPVSIKRRDYGNTTLNREGLFPDPVRTGTDIIQFIKKLRELITDRPRDLNLGGAIVVFGKQAP